MGTQALAWKDWAASEELVGSADIEQLKGLQIAIDAEDYLLSILASLETREPLLPALGGLPFALRSRVETDISHFKAAGIKPSFVFNGLNVACRDRATQIQESQRAMKDLDQAWKEYDDSRGELAVSNFGKACTYRIEHIVRSLLAMLHRLDVTVFRAPYTAASQMVTFERDGYVQGIAGSACCLVHGADKVITNFDFENHRFTWVEMKTCCTKLMMTQEQFVNLCLLSGSSICPIFPDIDSEAATSKIQATRVALGRVGNNAYALISKDTAYTLTFHKAVYAARYPVVIDRTGKVEPRDWSAAPSDVHEFIGQRLPEEVCEYLRRCVMSPRVLDWRTRREVVETPPLDGGQSQTYRDLVETKLLPLRAQALALITHSLHRYYQNTDVALACWFHDNERSVNVKEVTQPSKSADTWHVKLGSLPTIFGCNNNTTPVSFAISALATDDVAEKTVTPRQPMEGQILHGEPELRANVIWRFLADRGYIGPDHKLTAWGRVVKVALDTSQKSGIANQQTDETILMAFELIRLDLLNNKTLFQHPPYTGAPMRGTEIDKANTMLISRVACLGNLTHAEIGYTGPLSRHLLAYGQLAATVRESLRDLLEMHACHALLSGAVARDMSNREFIDIGVNLPLLNEPDLGLALVVKSYLDELSSEEGKRQDIQKWFNHAQDISGDLEKTWKIWEAIVAGVQAADNKTIGADLQKSFESADGWLRAKLKAADTPNGSS